LVVEILFLKPARHKGYKTHLDDSQVNDRSSIQRDG
jgi:hypothetical protein